AAARRLAAETRARFGWAPPAAGARPTADPVEGLRWLAFSREVGDRLFAEKAEQAALIHRLDPAGQVSPARFGFIDGFMPWDYTRLAPFADVVEADPYVSLDERVDAGRGRYNPGFASKLLSDLTGRRVRTIIQAFPYGGYTPRPADLDAWTAQALRAGATDISFYAVRNPRFTGRPLSARSLSPARRRGGAERPAAPADPATVVVYATASEGQARPLASGPARARTRADALYTTYAVLGELAHADFVFDADTRLTEDPARLARARTVFLPRGETLDRPFAEALLAWVRDGGTLVPPDPDAFTRAPDGSSLADVHDALVGPPLDDADHGSRAIVPAGALAPGLPSEALTLPVAAAPAHAFLTVPADAAVVASYPDGSPAALVRRGGAGPGRAVAAGAVRPAAPRRPARPGRVR